MTEQAQATEAQPAGLSLQDISAALQIIDTCVQRGAIRGEEMSAVGTVRDRFAAFLKEAMANAEGEEGEAPAEEESAA